MICLNEAELDQFRDTLTLLLAVHSPEPSLETRVAALAILRTEGVADTDGAQAAILNRLLLMAGRLL